FEKLKFIFLLKITSETATAQTTANASVKDVENLKELLLEIKKKNVENDVNVKRATNEAVTANELANQAENSAKNLERKYNEALEMLERKAAKSGAAKRLAEELRNRANDLAYSANSKLENLRNIENEYNQHEKLLKNFSEELETLNRKMTSHLKIIEARSVKYRECMP
uniref:Uncharacterized protein n=1 Tax=Strigamia maritima TaxID=126957 RepID=T1JK44_STRMM